jgi:hypothetical protein
MSVAGSAFSVGGTTLAVAGGRVGIGTSVPQELLHVAGTLMLAASTISVSGVEMALVPQDALMFFRSTACPAGWSEFAAAAGRYPLIRPLNGSTGTVVGTALTVAENRPVGLHTHALVDPGHSHGVSSLGVSGSALTGDSAFGDINYNFSAFSSGVSVTGITVSNANVPAATGTNAPYIPLLMCQKD